MDLAKLSEKKLVEESKRREAVYNASIDAAISAGLGEVRHSDMAEIAAGTSLLHRVLVARDYLAAWEAQKAIWAEIDARKVYHGSLKPIKRPA